MAATSKMVEYLEAQKERLPLQARPNPSLPRPLSLEGDEEEVRQKKARALGWRGCL